MQILGDSKLLQSPLVMFFDRFVQILGDSQLLQSPLVMNSDFSVKLLTLPYTSKTLWHFQNNNVTMHRTHTCSVTYLMHTQSRDYALS